MGKKFDEEYDEQETNLFDFLRECSESEENDVSKASYNDGEQSGEASVIGVKEAEPEEDDKQIYTGSEDSLLYGDDAEDCSDYYTDESEQNGIGDNYIDYAKNYLSDENEIDGIKNGTKKRRSNDRQHTFSLTFVIVMTAVITATAVIAGFGLLSGFDFGGLFGEESNIETDDTENSANIKLPVTDKQAESQKEPAAGEKKLQMENTLEETGSLILVNYAHEYMFPETKLVNLYSAKNGDYKISTIDIMLDRETVEALNSMTGDFVKETGKRDLLISSGFRSYDEQLELYSSAVESKGIDYAKKYISQPGCSEYHTGMSFDMSVYTDDGAVMKLDKSEEYSWILENCWEYGFVRRFDDAKADITGVSGKEWLFRYVGRPAAYFMTAEGISLEEYIELVMTKDYKHRLGFNEKSGKRYEVYFVPVMDGDYTDVTVPDEPGVTYDISGTNCGGFIVTLSFE